MAIEIINYIVYIFALGDKFDYIFGGSKGEAVEYPPCVKVRYLVTKGV
jgi:hypothetical protein